MGARAPWLMAALIAAAGAGVASAQTSTSTTTTSTSIQSTSIIELYNAHGVGTAADTIGIEGVRVTVRTPMSFGGGRFGWSSEESVYDVTYKFDAASLRLLPDTVTRVSGTAGAGGCATLTVTVLSSLQGAAAPIAGATIAVQSQTATTDANGVATLTSLPPGQSIVTVSAGGYGSIIQTADLLCSEPTEMAAALSPGGGGAGSLQPGQFRVVLTWGRNPSDLDSHLTGPISGSAGRFHVYYGSPQSGNMCGLDVDDVTSYGPETITCPRTGTTGRVLSPGLYRYSVHHFSGGSNIGTSGGIVRLELGDGTTQYFTPPRSGWVGSSDVWTVFELTVAADGGMSFGPVNTITPGVSASQVQAVPRAAAAPRGSDAALMRNLPRKPAAARLAASTGFSVDFSNARIAGAGQLLLKVDNIMVTEGGRTGYYDAMLRLDADTLQFTPESITPSAGLHASNCAAVNVTVSDASTETRTRVRGALVTIGNTSQVTGSTGVASFSGASEGATTITVAATGFATANQTATLSCTGTNAVEVNLALP